LTYSSDFETGEVKIKAEQVQSKDANYCALFDFNLEVEVTDEEGQIHALELEFINSPLATTSCQIPAKTNPQLLRIDPVGKILFGWSKVDVPEKLLIQNAKNGTDIFTRLWSSQELIKKGSATAMEAVRNLLIISAERIYFEREILGSKEFGCERPFKEQNTEMCGYSSQDG
jgi:hypothetical protein